jgi:hypothetical protein
MDWSMTEPLARNRFELTTASTMEQVGILTQGNLDKMGQMENLRWDSVDWIRDRIVVAVSGGPDSMFLLESAYRLSLGPDSVVVAHCNHGLRGEESDGDERFVLEQSKLRGLRCETTRMADPRGLSPSEQSLRQVRYGSRLATTPTTISRPFCTGCFEVRVLEVEKAYHFDADSDKRMDRLN